MENKNNGCMTCLVVILILVIILCNPLGFLFGSAVLAGFFAAIPKKLLLIILAIIIIGVILKK